MLLTPPPSDTTILFELGRRIQRTRLDLNLSQARLAEEAGLSLPTVQRLEAGSSVQVLSLLRVLRALGIADPLHGLLPAPGVRPMELLVHDGARRRRASTPAASAVAPKPWTWGD